MVKYYITPGAFYSYIRERMNYFGEQVINPEDAGVIIFSGGEDINPEIYGEKNTYSWFNISRDKLEIDVYNTGIKNSARLIGICRGHQLLLALNGAKLIQDIYTELGHEHPGYHDIISLNPVIPSYVNSLHHQGALVDNLPEGFISLGYEPITNILEATANYKKKIFTVQFHPEIMEEETFRRIISYFMEV